MDHLITALALVATTTCVFARQPMLTTVTGKMLGVEEFVNGKTIHSYQGVPYAEPPTGQRRFMKPIPLMPMPGVFNATRSPPLCMRASQIELHMSEDCLYINIWIPSVSGEQSQLKNADKMSLPIIIYVPSYEQAIVPDGAEFSANSDVIYVSINYRVGALGFLFSGSPEAPGNVGLHDILEAVRWVKLNSRLFGGNPEDITLWGYGEGAAVAAILMTSPVTTNLLRKVIFESGSIHTSRNSFRKNSEAVTMRLLVNAGCYNYSTPWEDQRERAIRCLKVVHPEVIVGSQTFEPESFQPVIGDSLIPAEPFQGAHQRFANPFRLLVLMKDDESQPTFSELLRSQPGSVDTTSDCKHVFKSFLRTSLNIPFGKVNKILGEYKLIFPSTIDVCREAFTDAYFFCPIKLFSDVLSTTEDSEVFFAKRSALEEFHPDSDIDEKLLISLGQFVRFGTPKVPGKEIDWPLYTLQSPNIVYLQPGNVTIAPLEKSERCHLWEPFIINSVENMDTTDILVAPEEGKATMATSVNATTGAGISSATGRPVAAAGSTTNQGRITVPTTKTYGSYNKFSALTKSVLIFVNWIYLTALLTSLDVSASISILF
ncbi:acetylcholinesterase-like [Tropilaelaps mercedesae]|uniref:Acetylcholinesterase-like n=1 Tax=Tropilaelaps mercedesae TaxID=418985 RepID=A0A1V9XC62_9ACAR|nr:acetylcholinesterase-like [Tropilaelaps mercedesae]